MEEKLITQYLQTLAANVENTIKEYIDEKITKEDKKAEINTHITVTKLRMAKLMDSVRNSVSEL